MHIARCSINPKNEPARSPRGTSVIKRAQSALLAIYSRPWLFQRIQGLPSESGNSKEDREIGFLKLTRETGSALQFSTYRFVERLNGMFEKGPRYGPFIKKKKKLRDGGEDRKKGEKGARMGELAARVSTRAHDGLTIFIIRRR